VTFPRALELHEVATMVPLDRLLVETDSPFLAPVPHRGKRNEPARVVRVAEAIAALRGRRPRRSRRARELRAPLQPVTATLHGLAAVCVDTPRADVSDDALESHRAEASAAVLAQMFEPIRDDLARSSASFARHVQSQVALIPTIGNYIQDGGGKRIRRGAADGGAHGGLHGRARACCTPSVIEFIHTATLVHDDIIDESELRRGREAVHTGGATTSRCSSATSST
jgi:hypothetical protein